MTVDPAKPGMQSWEGMGEDQLKLYAQELSTLVRKERQLRQQLEAKNRDLEQRIRELSALNSMFQEHLDMRRRTEDAFRRLVASVNGAAREAERLLRELEAPGRHT